jgi:hypothetical protein
MSRFAALPILLHEIPHIVEAVTLILASFFGSAASFILRERTHADDGRSRAVCSPCQLLSNDGLCAGDNGNDLLSVIRVG